MDRVDCIVIGAGVVGLAVARALALSGKEVVIVESSAEIGSATSSRNSEVIHAGIYYAEGSLKARLCVEGRNLLYDYCDRHAVPYSRCGKLIVATGADQRAGLERILARAHANGVHDLALMDRAGARALEPQLDCVAAVLSPSTGIVDSHTFMQQLLADAESAGAMLAVRSEVRAARIDGDAIAVDVVSGDGDQMTLLARQVINSAGLGAPRLARQFGGLPAAARPRPYFAKGNYFSLTGKAPFSRLIYPIPEAGGLGVHLTLDLGGQARFGPDVEWLDIDDERQIDYQVDQRRGDSFYASIRRYWPQLPDDALQPSYAGVRPKLGGPGTEADFRIEGPAQHGVAGLVNLFGIESPGLTASLAIARHVKEMLDAA